MYKYKKLGNHYICMQQNPLLLGSLYLFGYNRLNLNLIGVKRKNILGVLKLFIPFGVKNDKVVSLPIAGNICIQVHRGYKVFDYTQNTVTKVFSSEIEQSTVEREIRDVKEASKLTYAPRIRRLNLEEKWYMEDFIKGDMGYSTPEAKAGTFFEKYEKVIVQCLEDMLWLQPQTKVSSRNYINEMISSIEKKNLLDTDLDKNKVTEILRYINTLAENLNSRNTKTIYLAFSHGDYSLVNIVQMGKNLGVIDWEGVASRSILFDLYNYFLTELYYGRASKTLGLQVNRAITNLSRMLEKKASYLGREVMTYQELYRKIYYIERLKMLLDREFSNKQLDVAVRSMEVFQSYEQQYGNKN